MLTKTQSRLREVGIYRRVYPLASEAFITEQAGSLVRYRPTFILCTQLANAAFPSVALSRRDRWGMRQALFLLTRSPRLFEGRDFGRLDLLHAHFGPDGIYSLPLAQQLAIPLLVTFHGYDITVERNWLAFRSPLFYQLMLHERQLQRQAAGFIAVSRFIRERLIAGGYPAERVIQHYIGVDTAKFAPGRERPTERYILCVGRHTEKKGLDTLLAAFARIAHRYPDVSLVQVGTGALTRQLHAQSAALGLAGRVRFLGAMPHAEILRWMRGAEIFALPSQTARDGDSEALGIVFNEAAACAVPVVSTRHGGIPEAVLEGQTGFLVPERDSAALADRLETLLADRALARTMGRRAREFACEMFDIRKQAKKLELIYDSLK
ncbi:glycosyltransferase [Gloeobacter morelensis]|uniref:Glycosyltransferase n=1 Tax=Gloeobacter morelensis MG652769 TaxID=2781736 RepID=A0ABY3PJ90_9CYAN|nr:glycosyltransferase [Gloeobacter morelensis]UFP93735.1 glycosyltransferase [Gloeobacter morelensis MG652769]